MQNMKLRANDVHAMSLQVPAKLLGTKKMHTEDDIDMTELLIENYNVA